MSKILKISDPEKRFVAFVIERERVRLAKESGETPPWTADPILRDYRFCCVRREDDRVTRWIAENWRTPHADHEDLWFLMCVARLYNQPEFLARVLVSECLLPWRVHMFGQAIKWYKKEHDGRVFNAAYIVSTSGISMDKNAYICREILTPLWESRARLRPRPGDTLCSYHMLLGQMQGFGSFMAAQVVADLKYVEPLRSAADWWTFAASGPGSRRGLNYVLGRPRKSPWTEENWRMELARLHERVAPALERGGVGRLHAQDLQNCLCEFSKYERARLMLAGDPDGKMPKQRYRA